MVACWAIDCTNRSNVKKPGVTFHRFPANQQRRNEWTKAVRRDKWQPSIYTRICSEHFLESDFIKTSSSVRLKPDAVPSVFKAFPKYLQKKTHERKPSAYFSMRCVPEEPSSPPHDQSSGNQEITELQAFHNSAASVESTEPGTSQQGAEQSALNESLLGVTITSTSPSK